MAHYRFGVLVILIMLTLGGLSYSPSGQAAPPTGPGISLSTTVGTNPNSCAPTDAISVPPGTAVTYCYTVTNNTGNRLTAHDLSDSVIGPLFLDYGYALAPGASFAITTTTTVNATTTNTGTWRTTSPIDYTVGVVACGSFPDITATGTPLNLLDDGVVDVALPGSFPFYDTYLTSISVSNNGVVTTPGAALPFTNEAFPNATYRRVIAPYWDDLDEETGNVYVGSWVQAVNPENKDHAFVPPGAEATQGPFTYFVVEWYERSHFPGPSASTGTFALAMLYPGQGFDGYMFTCYADTDFGDPVVNSGASATVGLNQNGVNADLYSFNTPDAVFNGLGALRFDVTGLPLTYTASDSATVTVVAPEIEVSPSSFNVVHNPAPQSTLSTLTIQNVGAAALNWNITEAFDSCGVPTEIGWLGVSIAGGSTNPTESTFIDVGFNSTGLPNGVYTALLCISSNDTDEPLLQLPVQLSVTNPGPTATPSNTPTKTNTPPPGATPTVTNTPPPGATVTATNTPPSGATVTATNTPPPGATITPTGTPAAPVNNYLYLPIVRRR